METKVIKKVSKKGDIKYQYYVNNKLVRTSNREYVASTKDGAFFFGRPDLIGKGNYQKYLESAKQWVSRSADDYRQILLDSYDRLRKDYQMYASDDYPKKLTRLYPGAYPTIEEAKSHCQVQMDIFSSLMKKYAWKLDPVNFPDVYKKNHQDAVENLESLQIVYYDWSNVN